jgi:hypothetical protein
MHGRLVGRKTILITVALQVAEPQDVARLTGKLAMTTADVTIETAAFIACLDAPDWRDRDAAAALLSADIARLPQLRRALTTLDLTPEQRRMVELLTAPPSVGVALANAVKPNQ